MRGLKVRSMEEGDLAGVMEIEKTLPGRPWTQRSFRESLASESSHIYVVTDQDRPGRILGYLVCLRALDEGEIVNVAADEKVRGRGIGRFLLDQVLKAESDAAAWTLEVRESNAAARRLYETAGFHVCGRRRDFYVDPAEDALIMRLDR